MTIACLESGVVNMELNAAGSWNVPFCPVCVRLQTGEHTEYAFSWNFGMNDPFGLQFVTTVFG